MKKNLKQTWPISAVLVVAFLYVAALLYGSTSVGTITETKHIRGVRVCQNLVTALDATPAAVWGPRKVAGMGWTLWVLNTGDHALTSLDISALPDTDNIYHSTNLGDSAGNIVGVTSLGCTDTLASGATCMLSSEFGLNIGNLVVVAAADNTSTAELTIILFENLK